MQAHSFKIKVDIIAYPMYILKDEWNAVFVTV